MPFHPGIVGLRAIAVLSVVIFHFVPWALPGGFIGVDIFFVISGYLISKTIYAEVDARAFSFTAFYERRARRILPAFVAVSLATAIAAFFILLPQAFANFAKSLAASALFGANIWFYATSDYFAAAADQLPLLHLWSLGVEEQFYLIFPVLIIVIAKVKRSYLPATLCLLAVASLAACEWVLNSSPSQAFYLLPYRAFEFLLGAILALPGVRMARSGNLTGLIGLATIAISLAKISEASRFPGITAAVPCLGVLLVIWSAHRSDQRLGRALASPPMRFISDRSYSLYLVHWPVQVLGKMALPDLDAWTFALGGLAASIALADLSYRLVEQPVRTNRRLWTQKAVFAGSGAAIVFLALGAAVIVAHDGFPGRVSDRVNEIMAVQQYDNGPAFRQGTCFLRPEQKAVKYPAAKCLPKVGRPLIVLWGDSHMAQYYHGLLAPLTDAGFAVGQATASACAPVVGMELPTLPNCRPFNDIAIKDIAAAKPAIVVLGAVWLATQEQMQMMEQTIAILREAGAHVVIIGPSAIFKRPVPQILADRLRKGDADIYAGGDFESVVVGWDRSMKAHFEGRSDITYVSVMDVACPAGCRLETPDHKPMHFDIAHLTLEGSEYYGALLAPKILATTSIPTEVNQ